MSARDHMESVAGLACLICLFKLGKKTYGCEVHHAGDAEERSDWAVVPLCPEHHRGATGVHGMHRRPFERFWKVTPVQMLAWTNQLLAKEKSYA